MLEGGPVRAAVRSLLSFVETRAQLAANEFEEQSVRFFEIGLWLLAGLMMLLVALLLGALAIVLAFWDTHRIIAAWLLAFLFFGGAALCTMVARRRLAERPRFLAATLEELARDRDRLENP